MKKNNDIVQGLSAKVKMDENDEAKIVVVVKTPDNLGYDGCGTHTHK